VSGRTRIEEIFLGRRYRLAFIRHCHRLIALGYARLNAQALCNAEETEITGELVRAMAEVLDDESGPNWTRFFFVADDPPQNVGGRLGRRRLRVDIEFIESRIAPRNHFRIEAKRLCRSSSVAEYLGPEGLGMFLSGGYASEEDEGGMLGYVQTGTVVDWLDRIGETLRSSESLSVCPGSSFDVVRLGRDLDLIHLSCHGRQTVPRNIHIFHTLLSFL
jgi:hypothetical protein